MENQSMKLLDKVLTFKFSGGVSVSENLVN